MNVINNLSFHNIRLLDIFVLNLTMYFGPDVIMYK